MGFVSILDYARQLIGERMKPGDCAVDATVGNGVDTLFLAELAGPQGFVYGFDIQRQALDAANAKLRAAAERTGASGQAPVQLLLRSHAEMAEALPSERHGEFAAVMFNLGYLPGFDHTVITQVPSTIAALEQATAMLCAGGIVTVVVYPGHAGGDKEAEAVGEWAAALSQQRFQVLCYRFMNQQNTPPYLFAIEKRV